MLKTSNSPPASEVPLIYQYSPTEYGIPPDKLPCKVQKVTQITKPNGEKKKNIKKLHGVTY